MPYKAVIFDLFETLITEWGHKKYTKNELCADLNIDRDNFDTYWNEKASAQYLGTITFQESLQYVCEKCRQTITPAQIETITAKRIQTKSDCFNYILPEVFALLEQIKTMGLKTAIVSNCSSEEVEVLKESKLCNYFDEIILSYEVGMKKPDICIYEEAAKRLGTLTEECLFVGDGGSNELFGAENAGMRPIQAKWYTNKYPKQRENIGDFLQAENPMDIVNIILKQGQP